MPVEFQAVPIGSVFTNGVCNFKKLTDHYATMEEFLDGTAIMNAVTADDDKFECSFNRDDLVTLCQS